MPQPAQGPFPKEGRDPEREARKIKAQFARISDRFFAGRPRKDFFKKRKRSLIAGAISVFGVAIGFAMSPWPVADTARHLAAFPDCESAARVSLTPARRGQPGYYRRHDLDGDGIACEPIPNVMTGAQR